MPGEATKRRLRLTTIVYWVLLIYIIAALFWWFYSLYMQTEALYGLQKENLVLSHRPGSASYQDELMRIEKDRRTDNAKYIGEGLTFLVLILVGAVYIYRSVRSQFRVQQQQQNFVMAITHELKTPIAVSRLNLETLQRHHLDENKRGKLLQMTLQETLRLDSLINNILISSQLDGQSYQVSKEELNLSDLVNDVACQFATRYPERRFVKNIRQDIDLEGDPLLLKLLVSNLLENANKYAPKETPISLELHEDAGSIRLLVTDEGPGITSHEKKNVFKKFYRLGNEQTRTTKGTGLGLYLCKKIADDHGGSIAIADNQPQGSIFIVSFDK
jgi:two-component system, OmpR family, sensor histidine kinase CiaH